MEVGLKRMEAQEQKYSAELDNILTEYAELQAQAVELDPIELYEARQAIRPTQEKAAEQQLEELFQKKTIPHSIAERQAANIPYTE